jgi:hypothetical protein
MFFSFDESVEFFGEKDFAGETEVTVFLSGHRWIFCGLGGRTG